jgi:hypothetical protein
MQRWASETAGAKKTAARRLSMKRRADMGAGSLLTALAAYAPGPPPAGGSEGCIKEEI